MLLKCRQIIVVNLLVCLQFYTYKIYNDSLLNINILYHRFRWVNRVRNGLMFKCLDYSGEIILAVNNFYELRTYLVVVGGCSSEDIIFPIKRWLQDYKICY